jgi:6-pyruvoyl-tetrahydropterin synthase
MSFVVEITKSGNARQEKTTESFDLVVKVGVAFADKQLKKKGAFVDTDKLAELVAAQAAYLSSDTWSTLFKFTPTCENVSKWLAEELKPHVKQLEYVELENRTMGIVTQYIP